MSLKKHSPWQENLQASFPKLNTEAASDIVIVGGGLAGTLTAYQLSKTGKNIVLLEADTIGSGATALTTAFITQDIDTELSDLVKIFGTKKAQMIWQSGFVAIETLEKIIKQEKIACDFMRCSLYIYATTEDEYKKLESEEKIAKKLGFKVRLTKNNDLNFPNVGYLELFNQAKFHPIKFLTALAKKTSQNGVKIFEQTKVLDIKGKKDLIIQTKHGKVNSDKVIIMTYQPFKNPLHTFMKKGMYVSYVMEVTQLKKKFREGIYLDLKNPYNYFRIDGNRMIVGGQDHRKDLPHDSKKHFKNLEEYLRGILGHSSYVITRKWTGPILEPSDGLPLIGEVKQNQFVATAFSGNGMTYSPIAALMAKDWVLDKSNPWTKLYDPKRIPSLHALTKKGKDYIEMNFK